MVAFRTKILAQPAAFFFAAALAGCAAANSPAPGRRAHDEPPIAQACNIDGPRQLTADGRLALEIRVPMAVDVDGAPNAYGPPGRRTLDIGAHARAPRGSPHPGEIVGYMTEYDGGPPTLQRKGDPFPGYYVSQTDFADIHNPRMEDPRRYVDASRINYVVQGKVAREAGIVMGDFALVYSCRTHRTAYAIVADSGNDTGAEGSLALLRALGYNFKNGIDESVDDPEIVIRYFPGSNPQQTFFRAQPQLDAAAHLTGVTH